jgi:hypothetical protein
MAQPWKAYPTPDQRPPPETIPGITRRYYACAVALAKVMGVPLTETFVREHRESISCCFIESGRIGLRLPRGVTLPPLGGKTPVVETPGPLNTMVSDDGQAERPDAPVAATHDQREERSSAASVSPAVEVPVHADEPPPVALPVAEGLPCGGALIVDLQPAQLAMLIGKVETLATAKGGSWTTLLAALQAQRQARLVKGRKPVLTPVPDPTRDVP